MRPSLVTDQEIIDAGISLRSDGARVTGSAIRKQLGGKGNVERFKRVWEAYLEGQGPAGEVEVPALPVEVETLTENLVVQIGGEVFKLAHAINQTANRVHEKRVREVTDTARQAEEQAAAELKEAAAAIDELEADLEESHEQLDKTNARAVEQSSEIAVLKSNLAETKLRADEADALEKQVGELSHELSTLRASVEVHLRAREEAEARHATEMQRARNDSKDAIGELKQSHQDQVEKLVKEFDQLKVSSDAVTDMNNSQKTQIAVLTEKLKAADDQLLSEKKLRDQQRADYSKELSILKSLMPKPEPKADAKSPPKSGQKTGN